MFRSLVSATLLAALATLAGCGPSQLDYPASPPHNPATPTGRVIRFDGPDGTLQQAIDAAGDGDTIVLAPGVHAGGVRIGGKSITLASRFILDGDRSAIAETVIEPAGEQTFCVEVLGTAGPRTRIIGLTLRGGRDGILCRARCEIAWCHIREAVDGIDYEGGGGICRHNLFEDNRDDAIDLDGDAAVVIEDNEIVNSGDDGIELRCYSYLGRRLDVLIRRNTITGSGEDGIQIIDHPGPSNRLIWIERNVIRDSQQAAIGFMDDRDTVEDYRAAEMPDTVVVLNNTLVDNRYGLIAGGNLVAVNNLVVRVDEVAVKGRGGLWKNNLFWSAGRWEETDMSPADAVVDRDPQLGADAVPGAHSPCIDAGLAEVRRGGAVVLKIPRSAYTGSAPDIGAAEQADTTGPN